MFEAVADRGAQERVLGEIQRLGLEDHVVELEAQGYTILRDALTPTQVARAKNAILSRVEREAGRTIDPENESDASLAGMHYFAYLLYEDEVFEEILMEPRGLALITWLLGESCLLSSMGCHLRGPGGTPMMLHSDNGNGITSPFSMVAMTANLNYALTPYSPEAGAVGVVPGSHRLARHPLPHENFQPGNMSLQECAERLEQGAADEISWQEPPGFKAMDLNPGDAVVWHGNTWHGVYRRDIPGLRMNLAVYCNRQFVQTQERHGREVPAEVLARHANDERFRVLLGAKQPYGWGREGPDYGLMARMPRGQFD